MKLFISWSGEKSQKVATVLKAWIPCVIQSVEPYFSSADIDKGARWSTDIAKELQNASFGILCVTKENLSSAWLNFEAGALSKSIDQSRVCPLLIDLNPSEITDSPVLQFQMAKTDEEDMRKLFTSINNLLEDNKLDEAVLEKGFAAFWPKIEEELEIANRSLSSRKNAKSDTSKEIDTAPAILEMLDLMRYQHKLLKTPTDLLPPDYLAEIIRHTGTLMQKDQYVEIYDLVHEIFAISESAIEELNREDMDIYENIEKMKTINLLSKRLTSQIRRFIRTTKYY